MNAPTDSAITQGYSWLTHHLIMLALVIGLTVGVVYFLESTIARHDHDRAIELQSIAQQLGQQNQLIQQQTKAEIESLTQQNVALQQEIGTLATAISTRDTRLQQTQATVPSLSPDQLSTEWMTRIKNAGQIKPILNGYSVDQPAAVASVQALESVPVLEQDKHDLQQINTNLNEQFTNETKKYDDEVKAHTSDFATGQAELKACKAEVKDVKAQARKRNIIAAIVGTAIGIVIKTVGL